MGSFTKAVAVVSSASAVRKLSLSKAIRTGRHLFAFQAQKCGGVHTFYSAVCVGNGFVSDVLRHVCCVAIQCALRARRSRLTWASHAKAALAEEVAGEKPQGRPWYKHTRARLEGAPVVDFRDIAHAPPRKARVQKPKLLVKRSEVKQKWMPMASQGVHNADESKDVDNDVSQKGLQSREASAVASGTHESAQQDALAEKEQDSELTEFSGMSEQNASDSTYSYESEEEGEWDLAFSLADDDYDSFQQALDATPRKNEGPTEAAAADPAAAPLNELVAVDASDGAECKTSVDVKSAAERPKTPSPTQEDVKTKGKLKSIVLKTRATNIMATVLASKRIQQVKPDCSTAVALRHAFTSAKLSGGNLTLMQALSLVNSAHYRHHDRPFLHGEVGTYRISHPDVLAVEESEAFQMSRINSAEDDAVFLPDSLTSKHLAVLLDCLCGGARWRDDMRVLLPLFQHTSALYQLLHDECEFLEMDARAEAACSLAQLIQRHTPSRQHLLKRNVIPLIFEILKKKTRGPSAAAASLLETLTGCDARQVLAWVQASSEFARVEIFILQLLEIIRLSRAESSELQSHTQPLQGADAVIYHLLNSIIHTVACIKAQVCSDVLCML